MSIEGVLLEHFSALPKSDINSTKKSCQRHSVFHLVLSHEKKQDSATTNAHSNFLLRCLKIKILTTYLSTIWGNTDSCAEKYKCASVLYLMSVMLHCY